MRIFPGLVMASVAVLLGWVFRKNVGEFAAAAYWPWLYVAAGAVLLIVVLDRVQWTGRTLATLLGGAAVIMGFWFASDDVPASTPGVGVDVWLLIAGPVLLLGSVVARFQGSRSFSTVGRWFRSRGKRGGFATRWQMVKVASGFAMRRKAKVMRPSLAQVSWFRRWFLTPTTEFATCVAKVRGHKIYSPIEDVTLRVGGPRTGKTGEIAGRILDAPGAVIATSTRTDLVELCGPIRSAKGPVRVFNPNNLGELTSTVTFNPLAGCVAPEVAVSRAEDLLSGAVAPGSGGDMQFWTAQAQRVLPVLLHAAALVGGSMNDVLEWVAEPEAAKGPVQKALRRSSQPAFELDAMQFLDTNPRTQSSICATIMPALGWLMDANAVNATTPTGDDTGMFDVAVILDSHGTVFLLGAEDGHTAPLVAALTGHIAREARRLAALAPSGRIDAPLTLALDEAALICPIPLDKWTADMGGRGLTIHIAVQGRTQLKQRWGDQGAGTIMNNSSTLLIFGATKEHEDLQAYSALTGERYEEVPTFDGNGGHSPQRVPTLSPAQIHQLKAGRVLVIRRGMPAALGKVKMAWKRHDVRAHKRRLKLAARVGWWNEATTRWAGHVARAGKVTAAATAPMRHAAGARFAAMKSRRSTNNAASAEPTVEPYVAPDYVAEEPVLRTPQPYRTTGQAPESIRRIHPTHTSTTDHTDSGVHEGEQS